MSYKRISKTSSAKKKASVKTQTIPKASEKLPRIDISDWQSKTTPMLDKVLKKVITPAFIVDTKSWWKYSKRKQTRTLEDKLETVFSLMNYDHKLNEYDIRRMILAFAILEKRKDPLKYIVETATIDDQDYAFWYDLAQEPERAEQRETNLRIYKTEWKNSKKWMKKHKEQYDAYKLILKHIGMKDLSYFYTDVELADEYKKSFVDEPSDKEVKETIDAHDWESEFD